MNPFARLAPMVAGLFLLVTITPSWGQTPVCVAPGCNPTVSDANSNTAGGTGALAKVVPGDMGGSSNTAFGENALSTNTIGLANTAIGNSALMTNTTGIQNTAVGWGAQWHSTGNKNIAVGWGALWHSTGNKNIAVGFKAGATLVNGNNNIYIGNVGASDESQTIRIGTAQAKTFIAGIVTAALDGASVLVDRNGQLGIAPSSARYKRDIQTMASRSDGLLKLRPVTFAYKDDAAAAPHYGLVAEEVATVYPELVTRTASGEVLTVKYQELIPMLLNELQRQQREFQEALQSQQQALQRQQQELAELRTLIGQGRETASLSR
jgi:Chaperone of endosialidase